jgi:hypothetical protein
MTVGRLDARYKGINENSCLLGSYYVLCALTMVSSDAANTLPWLYEAVNV